MNLQIESSAINKIDISGYATRHALTEEHGIERYSPPSLSLDIDGTIQKCGKSVETLFGYRPHELAWQHISCLFPKFSEVALVEGNRLNPLLSYLCHCDHAFEGISKQSDIIICNLNFFLIEHKGLQNMRLIVRPVANEKS